MSVHTKRAVVIAKHVSVFIAFPNDNERSAKEDVMDGRFAYTVLVTLNQLRSRNIYYMNVGYVGGHAIYVSHHVRSVLRPIQKESTDGGASCVDRFTLLYYV